MVEDGKITAEEGVKLLKALGEGKTEQKEQPVQTTALSENVDWSGQQQYQRTYKQSSGTSFFTDFLESALQKIRDMDLDFNFGSYVEIEHIFQHKGFFGDKVKISLENGSLKIIPSKDDDLRLECFAKVYRARDLEEARSIFFRDTQFQVTNGEFTFESKVKSIKLQLNCYLPMNMYEKIKLYSFNGHLQSDHVKTEKLEAKVVNGSITVTNVDSKKLSLETVNGKIEVAGGKANYCEMRTINGAITLAGQYLDSDVETVNGSIHLLLDNAAKSYFADLKAKTGSIKVEVPRLFAVEGKLKTNVGGFSCELSNFEIIEENKDFIQKSLKFAANKHAEGILKLTAVSHTGTITVKEKL